jgi:hypothetical protein
VIWFRFYIETFSDPKVRRLPVDQRWLWAAVLGLARLSPQPGHLYIGGNVPVTFHDVSDFANLELATVEAGMAAFVARGMVALHGDVWAVTNWDKRQFTSDTSTARVQIHRGKKSAEPAPRNVSETFPPPPRKQRPRNVSWNVSETDQIQRTESLTSPNGEVASDKPDASPRTKKANKSTELIAMCNADEIPLAMQERDHKALKQSPLSGAEVFGAYRDAYHRKWGGKWLWDNLSIERVIGRWAGFTAWRDGVPDPQPQQNGRAAPRRIYAGPGAVAEHHRLKGTFDGAGEECSGSGLGDREIITRLSGQFP